MLLRFAKRLPQVLSSSLLFIIRCFHLLSLREALLLRHEIIRITFWLVLRVTPLRGALCAVQYCSSPGVLLRLQRAYQYLLLFVWSTITYFNLLRRPTSVALTFRTDLSAQLFLFFGIRFLETSFYLRNWSCSGDWPLG